MFDTLLESRSRSDRFTGGAIASVTAHATLIAAAVFATAQARVQMHADSDVMRTVYFPPPARANPTTMSRVPRRNVVTQAVAVPIGTRGMNLNLPLLDLTAVPAPPVDFSPHAIGSVTPAQAGNAIAPTADGVYHADQVEKQVSFIAGSAAPRYPEALRSSGVEGRVVALFVVDERGFAAADSVRFLRSDNALFDDAVRRALPRMRFVPAEIGGRKVRQLVQMPFLFTLGR